MDLINHYQFFNGNLMEHQLLLSSWKEWLSGSMRVWLSVSKRYSRNGKFPAQTILGARLGLGTSGNLLVET